MSKNEESIEIETNKKSCLMEYITRFKRPDDIVSFRVNGLMKSLNTNLYMYSKKTVIKPVYRDSIDGEAVLRRSLVFVMAYAMHRLNLNKDSWFVEHQLSTGYFCCYKDLKKPCKDFCSILKKEMQKVIDEKIEIKEKKMYYNDALNIFKEQNYKYSLSLLKSMNDYEVRVNAVNEEFFMLCHRVLMHNTKMIKEFDIVEKEGGWVLNFTFFRYKEYYQPDVMSEDRVIKIHRDQDEFASISGVECVGDLNRCVLDKTIETFVSLYNTHHSMVMNKVARDIAKKDCRLILIAGPSASGKTTFANNLRRVLKCRKRTSHIISVDNYFKRRVDCPVDPVTGQYDYEKLEALRIEKLNKDLNKLFKGEKVKMPIFNFHTGLPEEDKIEMQIDKQDVLIMEGIHCLNDKLTGHIDKNLKFKIFIAPLTPINLDDRNYISNKVIRLIRRIVRDKTHRGYTVEDTLRMWPSVRRGEHLYIFPYINNADFIFNTAFDYEVGMLKPYVKPQLKSVKPNSKFFDEAKELLVFLEKFIEIPIKYLPQDSLLWEFIGGHWLN